MINCWAISWLWVIFQLFSFFLSLLLFLLFFSFFFLFVLSFLFSSFHSIFVLKIYICNEVKNINYFCGLICWIEGKRTRHVSRDNGNNFSFPVPSPFLKLNDNSVKSFLTGYPIFWSRLFLFPGTRNVGYFLFYPKITD